MAGKGNPISAAFLAISAMMLGSKPGIPGVAGVGQVPIVGTLAGGLVGVVVVGVAVAVVAGVGVAVAVVDGVVEVGAGVVDAVGVATATVLPPLGVLGPLCKGSHP
ncbi:MAG: hypothetical protein NVS3B20_21100 [Polyangiales bacterium]